MVARLAIDTVMQRRRNRKLASQFRGRQFIRIRVYDHCLNMTFRFFRGRRDCCLYATDSLCVIVCEGNHDKKAVFYAFCLQVGW